MLLRACFSDKHICELQQKMVGTEKFRQSTGEYNRFISLNETNLPKVSHNSYHISLIFFILQHLTFPKHLMRKVIYSWIYFFFFGSKTEKAIECLTSSYKVIQWFFKTWNIWTLISDLPVTTPRTVYMRSVFQPATESPVLECVPKGCMRNTQL